jgi:tetratricopeptide (TPR) repeat protein
MKILLRTNALLIAAFFSIAAPAAALDPIERVESAVRLFQAGKPDSAAVILYDTVDLIGNTDERVKALYFLAQSLGQLGRIGEKIQYLSLADSLSRSAPYADEVRCAYAEVLLSTGNENGCLAIAQEFFTSHRESPLMPDMLSLAGDALSAKGEWLKAYNAYSDLSKNFPDSFAAVDGPVKEGICLFRLNLYSGAIERFEQYMADHQKGDGAGNALYYLGISREKTGQYRLAADALKKLTIECPSSPFLIDAFYHLGKNLFEAGDYAEAENAFMNYLDNSRRSDSSYDEALLYLERIAYRKGYYTSESEIAEHFAAKNPSSRLAPRLLLDVARYYRLSGEPERAIEKYRSIMNTHPQSDLADSAMFYAADTYISMNRREEGAAFLREAAYRRSDRGDGRAAYFKLGLMNEENGLYDDAIAWYDSSVALGGSTDVSVRSLIGVGRCYLAVNHWLDASRTYERILKTYPGASSRADVYLSLAEVYYLMGRLFDSVQTARDGLRIAQGSRKTELLSFLADAYEYIDADQSIQYYWSIWSNTANPSLTRTEAILKIGDIYARKGDRKSAAEAYTRVLSVDADSLTVRKARKKIDDLNALDTISDTSKSQ